MGLTPGSGRFPGGGHDTPLQYSFLENPMDRGAWQAAAHGVAKSRTAEATWHAHRDVIKSNGKNPTEAARLSLPVWAGIQPRMSPAAGVPQRPAPRRDGDLAGRPGPSLRAELSRPAACTVREETGLQTQASVQGMLHYSVLDLKQPTQENNSITLKLDFPPKSQQPWEYLKALTKAGFRTAKHKIGGLF